MECKYFLKTCKSFVEHIDVKQSKNVIDKFIESCLHLDASIFEPLMEEEDVFETKEKYRFLTDLKRLFDKGMTLTKGNFRVNVEDRTCKGCSLGRTVKHPSWGFANPSSSFSSLQ
jgi:hypothetical protein